MSCELEFFLLESDILMKLGTCEASARHIISLVVFLLLLLFTPYLNTFKKVFFLLFITNKSFVLYLFQSCPSVEK